MKWANCKCGGHFWCALMILNNNWMRFLWYPGAAGDRGYSSQSQYLQLISNSNKGLCGVQLCSHTTGSDIKQNQTTAPQESDLFIKSMITDRIRWHKVLLLINHQNYNFCEKENSHVFFQVSCHLQCQLRGYIQQWPQKLACHKEHPK